MDKVIKAFKKMGSVGVAILVCALCSITVVAIDCVNIHHTGDYQCEQNTEGFITIRSDKIGTMAYYYGNSVYLRATTQTGGITSQGFTATLSNPKKCDSNGYFTGGQVNGQIILKGNVSGYTVGGFFTSTDYIRITNTNATFSNGNKQTFNKPYNEYYS